jgi:hypothetical protein
VELPEVHYARSGDIAIAYQVVGDGHPDIIFVEVVPEPLEGQTIHEVELPAELEAIEDGADLMRALSDYRISAGKAKLVRR